MGLSNEEANALCKPSLEATKGFELSHTMYHIKDPRKSLKFYSDILGMSLLLKMDSDERKCSVFYLGYKSNRDAPEELNCRKTWALSSSTSIELFHWWGSENDDKKSYNSGNGYGHIGIRVPDIETACARLENLGVEFTKKLHEGMYGLAYIKDPDGYEIEIFNAADMATC